tara:strand:- start:780 stop:1670 length:891 start_codon:yes stop_codon:yes gene_type:complete
MNSGDFGNAESGLFDCHAQIIDLKNPEGEVNLDEINLGKDIKEKKSDFSLPEYRALCDKLSITGTVLMQPEDCGYDHQILIKTITEVNQNTDEKNPSLAVGIATLDLDVTDNELENLKSSGIVGAQLFMKAGENKYQWDEAERLAWRVHDLGWHVDIKIDGSDLHEVEQRLASWPGYIILHHIGLFLRTKTLKQRGFKALTRLIDRDKVWVKLSAPYNSSRGGLIDDPEVGDIARALITWAPERMVWGSNWPHPEYPENKPNDFDLYRIFCDWIPERSRRKMILSKNPATLYSFDR